jgi:hypothetical protein
MIRNKGLTVGSYHISKIDVDYFRVDYTGCRSFSVKICGGDLETVLNTLFVDTERII